MASSRSGQLTLEPAIIEALKASLRGHVDRPEDPGYDAARRVYNGMIDTHPGLIAHCASVADVIASVNFAREKGLAPAVRGGGHSFPGFGTNEGGLVIDLSPMKGIRVDPEARTARVEAGCRLSDLDHATHAFGLATPAGILSTTGVAGLTLGGGIGHLTRKFGLAIDNVLEVDMVLADGSFVTASADRHGDLFWAVRGGGGNFGVVTSFLFRLHPVATVVAGPTLYSLEQTHQVMRWYREFLPQAPEDLDGFFAFLTVPPGPPFPEALHLRKMCGVVWCYCGPLDRADEVFKPVQAFGPPALYGVQPMPYPALQSAFDALYPPGLNWYLRADFLHELPDEAIALHARFAAELPTVHSTMHLYPIDGAVHQVAKNATAFSYRDARWAKVIAGVSPDPSDTAKIKDWTVRYWEALHRYSAGGAYVNFLMDEGQERVKATYRDNYDRLAKIKRKYDPQNLFRANQNIVPAPT